jgi:hypothetical protein
LESFNILNAPPVCNAGGPYVVECGGGTSTVVSIDGRQSSDANNDQLVADWRTNGCYRNGGNWIDHGGEIANPTAMVTTIAIPKYCSTVCYLSFGVSDGMGTSWCTSSTVTVQDTLPPAISAQANAMTVESDGAGNAQELES